MAAAEATADDARVREALDRQVADSLGPISACVAGLFAFFAVADWVIQPRPQAYGIVAGDVVAAFALLLFRALVVPAGIPARLGHAYAAALALVALLPVLQNLRLVGDTETTTYVLLIVVGAGTLLLDWRWLALVAASSFAAWALVASGWPDRDWTTAGLSLVTATVLAFLVHEVRRRAYVRTERMRLEDERVKRELAASEARHRRLVDEAPDAFVVHIGGTIAYVNAAAVRLFGGRDASDLVGREVLDLVHPDYRDVVRERIRRIVAEGKTTERMEMRAVALDGRELDIEAMGQPVEFNGQRADQSIVRDVTERRQAERERRLAAQRLGEIERLKELDRMRTQFVNALSHELRTPLTPMKVHIHILRTRATDDAQRRAADLLERNFERVRHLVDELLEVARVQAGTLRIERAPMDLGEVVREAAESFETPAAQAGVRLEVATQPSLALHGDARRIGQVVYNLVGNALKFTPAGGRVRVEAAREGAHLRLRVSDDGAGLASEDIAKLFEPFSQVHDPMQKTHAGTGLGLYICKGIVEQHGGTIRCESGGPGRGAAFTASFPLVAAEKVEVAPPASSAHGRGPPSPRAA